jgi:hypothetical protein
VWVRTIEQDNGIYGNGIVLDDVGNIYTTGEFRGTVDFDPGDDTYNVEVTDGGLSLYILKLNNDGEFLWVKVLDSNNGGNNFVETIALDAARNVYISGEFLPELDFDPGVDTYFLPVEEGSDLFIEKLDTDGNFLWAKAIEVSDYSKKTKAMVTDLDENIYTTGYFSGTADFDPSVAEYEQTAVAYNDVFIQKLDSNGDFEWAVTMGGSVSENSSDITLDSNGNIYSLGKFRYSIDFDPSEATYYLTSNGSYDIYVQKLDPDGNFIWAKSFGGPGSDGGNAIALDLFDNIYISGGFFETADFDPSDAIYSGVSVGDMDIFILKLDENGDFKWVQTKGGIEHDIGIDISLDNQGNVYTTGVFRESVDFNPEGDPLVLSSNGENDVFITKLSQDALGNDEIKLSEVSISPNPSSAIISISWSVNDVNNLNIIDISGKKVFPTQYINKDLHSCTLNLSELSSGVYFVQINGENGNLIEKLILN